MVKYHPVRIQVPKNDPEVITWCNNQGRSLSVAIRLLIQREIAQNGTGNMFATDNGTVLTIKSVKGGTMQHNRTSYHKPAKQIKPANDADSNTKPPKTTKNNSDDDTEKLKNFLDM